MTDIVKFDADDAEVICDASASKCYCVLPPGHDGPHVCSESCGGSWSGDHDGPDFKVHSWPNGGGGAAPRWPDVYAGPFGFGGLFGGGEW